MINYIGEYDDPDSYSDNPGEGSLMISAEDQTWDKQTLQMNITLSLSPVEMELGQ